MVAIIPGRPAAGNALTTPWQRGMINCRLDRHAGMNRSSAREASGGSFPAEPFRRE